MYISGNYTCEQYLFIYVQEIRKTSPDCVCQVFITSWKRVQHLVGA